MKKKETDRRADDLKIECCHSDRSPIDNIDQIAAASPSNVTELMKEIGIIKSYRQRAADRQRGEAPRRILVPS